MSYVEMIHPADEARRLIVRGRSGHEPTAGFRRISTSYLRRRWKKA